MASLACKEVGAREPKEEEGVVLLLVRHHTCPMLTQGDQRHLQKQHSASSLVNGELFVSVSSFCLSLFMVSPMFRGYNLFLQMRKQSFGKTKILKSGH